MKRCKDEGFEETDDFMCLESDDGWVRFDLTDENLEIDKFGEVYLTQTQAVRLANKILKFWRPK